MAKLTSTFTGITSPNQFGLASAPPTVKEYNVCRAFIDWNFDFKVRDGFRPTGAEFATAVGTSAT